MNLNEALLLWSLKAFGLVVAFVGAALAVVWWLKGGRDGVR